MALGIEHIRGVGFCLINLEKPGFPAGDRPGHDQHARDPVRCHRRHPSHGAGRAAPDLSPTGLGRARSGGDLAGRRRDLPRGDRRRARPPDRRDRHHQPARNHGAVGTEHRPPGAQRDRLAGPAHRRACAKAGAMPGWPSAVASAPVSSSTRISRRRRSAGCSMRCPACASAPAPARSRSARSTAFCCGG